MKERPHQRLEVWKKSIELVRTIYSATSTFPKDELFALISQMRRAAVSVPSNISEGAARWSSNEKLQFFRIARSSLSELETQLEISRTLGYLDSSKTEDIYVLTNQTGRLLNGLIFSRERRAKV